ncbi:MAG: phospholipase, partial [Rhodospirillales bacterium]
MSDLPSLRGPILEPASGGTPKQLVILCHGVGSDGQDLIDLARYYQKVLPDAKFISPDAPFAYDMAPSGYQWFSLQDMSPGAHLTGTQQAAPILDDFIDAQLAENGLTESELALVGFSQGTMMCLYVGLRRELQIVGIIGYSGTLVGEELLAAEIKSKPPVLLVHGDADEVVSPQALPVTVAGLENAGVAVQHEI